MTKKKSEAYLIWRGDTAMKLIEAGSYEKLYALGEDIVSEVKEFISQPGTGKFYKKSRTVWYQASAPGFPPTVKTGELKVSVGHAVVSERNTVYLLVGTTEDYGVYLEVGTRYMEARPWLRTILVKLSPDTKNFIIKKWRVEEIPGITLPKGYGVI